MTKYIDVFTHPEGYRCLQSKFGPEGFSILGIDKDDLLWRTTFEGYYCHRFVEESFAINLYKSYSIVYPKERSDVYEYVDSDFIASLKEAGVDVTGLRHFGCGDADEIIEVIATHPPAITRVG